ncbi:hypothetical protein H7F50_07215 [Novosphingobium flavum]|uniref:Glycosyltransferase RgtA/B/C/D-like domain-containing protein n=1 Tax=Novosphingobium aerophilum TaxID=2839843 RepID=A0A7X1FAI3_9SPHN|nr:hypothetical protein [Novosphingobium aerophilum]MBC2653154.1 hypothetical protein [Novosphingobium aerophilum]MBC2661541.1 hypothetical protein [Novosphingobium aerophilum]
MSQPTPAPAVVSRLSALQLGLILLVCVAAGMPGILAHYPQMTDYPAHLARWYIMIDNGHTPDLARYYAFRWVWSGNLGADLLIRPLAAVFGLEVAGRLLVITIPMLVAGGLFTVEWTLRRRIGVGALLALATVWSPALLMGFLNFELALAGALFAFALWVRMAGSRWREATFVPIGILVWVAHQSGWGVLGVMVFAYEWSRQGGSGVHPLTRLWRAGLATWPLWLPFLPTVLASQQAEGSFNYGKKPLLVKWSFWKGALRDRVRYIDYATTLLLLIAPLVALWFRRLDGRLAIGAVLILLLSLIVPRHLGGGDLADLRLIAVGLMLLALAIDWRPAWPLMWVAIGPFALRLAITSAVWTVHSANVAYMMKALDQIPRGARVAVAVREEVGLWAQPLYGHLGCYATLRRDALVNNHFAIPGVHMLTLTPAAWKWVDPSHRLYARAHRTVKLAKFKPAMEADYLWYFGKYAPADLPPGARVIFRSKHSLLARLANSPQHR